MGLPTALAGLGTAAAVLLIARRSPWPVLGAISWSVLPLVAGLFVLVEALDHTGVMAQLATLLRTGAGAGSRETAWVSGVAVALLCNGTNNLPAGLIAGTAVRAAQSGPDITGALLIGVDLGPNLSVTGSLATILWLGVLRREGLHVGAATFLRLGVMVMPLALLLALAALLGPALLRCSPITGGRIFFVWLSGTLPAA